MRDGFTRKAERAPARNPSFEEWCSRVQASLCIVAGGAEGTEYPIERARLTVGRGPGVDLCFDDTTMSKEHAIFEFADGGLRVRDLGSMNGIQVNDVETPVRELESGDRVRIGEHVLQLVLDKRERPPKTWVVSED